MSINKYFIALLLYTHSVVPFTIMLDPSGDAKHTGRIIQDTFERGVTLQCVELLKKEINKELPHIRVVITRIPGETIQPLQNASFSNRLQADFHLSVSFYPEPDIPSHVTIFQYLTNQTDYWHTYNPLSFYHISQAHLINIEPTTIIGKKFLQTFENKTVNLFFITRGLFALPFKPLVGIKAPCLAIEAGLAHTNDFKQIIKPLITCIKEITT